MTTFLVVASIVVGVVVALGVLALTIRKIATSATVGALADPAVAGAISAAPALLGGIDAEGVGSTHGNGALALHRDRLVFVLGMPRRTIEIPLADVTSVEVAPALRMPGRYSRGGGPWLTVQWRQAEGTGTAGVLVPEPKKWAQAIRPGEWIDTTG